MCFIHVIIENTGKILPYITIVRKFNNESISTIKNNIITGQYVISFDWNSYGFLDEINDIDPKEQFKEVVYQLLNAGAKIQLLEEFDGRTTIISLQLLENLIKSDKKIRQQIELENDLMFGD